MKVKLFITKVFCVSLLLVTVFSVQSVRAQDMTIRSIQMPGAIRWMVSSSRSSEILRFVPRVNGDWAWGSASYFKSNGDLIVNKRIGIGTTKIDGYRLAVKGTIRAREIRVTTSWSDFVFAEDYALPTLDEVESHIKTHKHLPDIPSAAEVEAKGVELGVISSKLLQKIEELTLYVIEQEKRIEALEAENKVLQTVQE